MFYKLNHILGLAACVSLLGCRQASSKNCVTPQALLTDATAIHELEPIAPAGGYIQYGARACTVTLALESASNREIRLTAYTAQHCVREDQNEIPNVSLSVYLPSGDGKGSGYMKNIPVKDDFFERRKEFLNEVMKLKVPAATEMARSVSMIPLLSASFYNNSGTDSDDGSVFSFCLDKETPRLTVPNAQQVCWAHLDSSVRRLVVSAPEIGIQKFSTLKKHLEKRRSLHDSMIARHKKFSTEYANWSEKIASIEGGNRLLKYANIAAFLNEDVCKSLDANDPSYPVCAVREPLHKLVDKYLVELDVDGKSKSILRKFDELGLGTKTPFTRPRPANAAASGLKITWDIRDVYREHVTKILLDKINASRLEMGQLFSIKDQKIAPFGKHLTIATNSIFYDAVHSQKRTVFSLVGSKALFGSENSLPAPPFSSIGALRIYLPRNQSKLTFSATDSGSMITFGGTIPLLVLHTVDDKPVSGGASILALPVATSEEWPVSKNAANASNSPRAPADTGVEVSASDSLIGANEYLTACN